MSNVFRFESERGAYILSGPEGDDGFRIVVPADMVEDEAGAGLTEGQRLEWLHANLAGILSAYTARTRGGHVKEPWNRVLVEEIE
ncbi:hypothetical protein BV394_00440 [Brevirhabdus pacifica]|uniref:Uncharacterized protein n=1 Tax=Brevirhabdus pacifica TaxID=1267768 RepID=A0A1U7DET1_9RHOB|nr:hypothetical protein [Brevirhabdus pacifica]APX88388.1 hypothetical protein BV394_00440 [Brevirhabdus pacifica]OWU79703.1 hypothetical protein ATO5_01135 [Loktanella sp. 22II-4b]PJJ87157.1 hypothetical protein CLV77_1723 [Brevirhabdus pacifica]